jgi:hypothetical protein
MRARIRGVITIMLFLTWSLVALSGFLLFLAPRGQDLLFLTRRECGEIHFWFAAAAVTVTIVHLILEWKAVKSSVRLLVHSRREHTPHE